MTWKTNLGFYIALALVMGMSALGVAALGRKPDPCANSKPSPNGPLVQQQSVGKCTVMGVNAEGSASVLSCTFATDQFKVSLWKRIEGEKHEGSQSTQ